jgi:hypothetical protein
MAHFSERILVLKRSTYIFLLACNHLRPFGWYPYGKAVTSGILPQSCKCTSYESNNKQSLFTYTSLNGYFSIGSAVCFL